MIAKPEHIEHDPFASRRQPQQGERLQSDPREERGSAGETPRQAPRERPGSEPSPKRPGKDPADDLMQGGD